MKMEWLSSGHLTLMLLIFHFLCISPVMSATPRMLNHIDKHATNETAGFRVNLSRRDTHTSFKDRFHAAVERSKQRAHHIAAFVERAVSVSHEESSIESPVGKGQGEFLMDVGVGTPTVNFKAIVDTGSDLIWTQCQPCQNCYKQSTPIFDPSKSSTYSTIHCGDSLCSALADFKNGCNPACSYTYRYGDTSSTTGVLAYETLSIGSGSGARVPRIGFGCGHDNEGQIFPQGGGLVGLGRGALSLITQLGSKVDNRFSYCLLPISDPPTNFSPLIFGDAALVTRGQTITLLKNPQASTFWYIPLTGLTLGGNSVDIPSGAFDISAEGSGGVIIDSGTTVTMLVDNAYGPLRDAVMLAVSLPPGDGSSSGLDLCYQTSDSANVVLPSMTFQFGKNELEIPPENVFIQVDEETMCLAFLGAGSSGPSILGNVQQQNIHFVYDNAQNTLSFQPTQCDTL